MTDRARSKVTQLRNLSLFNNAARTTIRARPERLIINSDPGNSRSVQDNMPSWPGIKHERKTKDFDRGETSSAIDH
ncbi:hypothetical protein RRG08_010476 [Elysia crispata]|uniref:Uncharacterized protein n=1 Tax=Elysia crispata TaxID=231223 RepID=A0AAE1E219_9GAST|nr:hypothetical protein RRG08_010476 [Elysia crispata]